MKSLPYWRGCQVGEKLPSREEAAELDRRKWSQMAKHDYVDVGRILRAYASGRLVDREGRGKDDVISAAFAAGWHAHEQGQRDDDVPEDTERLDGRRLAETEEHKLWQRARAAAMPDFHALRKMAVRCVDDDVRDCLEVLIDTVAQLHQTVGSHGRELFGGSDTTTYSRIAHLTNRIMLLEQEAP